MSDRPKQKIAYSDKYGELVVYVSDEELAALAKAECAKHGRPELLNKRIYQVSYGLPVDETQQKRKVTWISVLIVVLSVAWVALTILGAIKLGEVAARWLT